MKDTILVVDDNIANLSSCKNVLRDNYRVVTAPSGQKALHFLDCNRPDLILLDIDMPEMDGYTTIRHIKAQPRTQHIPVIFLTAMNDKECELDGLSLGAVDYISKPFTPALLQKRIEMHLLMVRQQQQLAEFNRNLQQMVDAKTQKITQLQDTVLSSLAELVEFRDGTTGAHIERTRFFLNTLLKSVLQYSRYEEETAGWDINLLVQSAQLHDVGKICIPDSILNKPGKLTEEEFNQMKLHTTRGREAIERISHRAGESEFFKQAAILAYYHHERWDGTGYPTGLAGDRIPLQGRLMAIADVYDALVSERPYKPAYTHSQAVNIIFDGAGTQFDPTLVGIFADVADCFADVAERTYLC